MKHKYVIIDSSKENHNSVDAKFKVQIPQGITGTTRVCVKSFSMPNSYHNIYGDLKSVKFVEFYRHTSGGDLRQFLHGFYTAVKITQSSSDGKKITSLCRSCVETWNSKNDGLWLSIVTPEVARPRSRRSNDGENARAGAFAFTLPSVFLHHAVVSPWL